MATTSEDAIGLKQALDYDGLQKQYCDLQLSFKEISERNTDLQTIADKAKVELEALKSLKLATELSKKETEEILKDLEQNESRLRALNTKTLEQLNEKRDALELVKTELSNMRQKVSELTVQVEHANAKIVTLASAKHELECNLSTAITRKAQIEENLKSFQRDYNNFREGSISERNKLLEKITDLRREKDHASDSADQLRLQLDHAKQNLVIADDKLNSITKERDQLKLSMGSTNKTYQDLSRLYEEHVTHSEKKISTLEDKIASITNEKSAIEKKRDELDRQLKDEKELCQEYFQQLTRSNSSSSEVQGSSLATGESKTSSQLLNLIRDYQKLNRRPEDIYQDFFELQAKYENAVTKNTHCEQIADTMTRKLNEKENLFSRLNRELESSKSKVKELSTALSKQNSECEEVKASNKKLANKINDLSGDKTYLEATLKDTTYQLQYLLSDVQRRNEPIPAALSNSSELLSATQLNPSLAHDQLVFKNVAELQDLNSKLVSEVRSLTEKVQSTSNEISNANVKRNNDVQFYKTAISEAKQTVSDLNDKSNDLQKQVDTLTMECDNYKKIINQLGDGDVKARFDQMVENQLRQREEMDVTFETYREETVNEINKLKEELESTRNSAIEARTQLTKVNVEIAHLNRKQINLTTSIEQRDEELKSARRQNSTLQERIISRDRELQETKDELANIKSRAEILANENVSLNHRVDTVTTAYNTMRESANNDTAEKSHMNSLLEAINSRMELFANNSNKNSEQFKETIEKLNRELQHARDTLAVAEKELDSYKSVDRQEIKDKYKESVIEIRLLKTKINELEQQLSNVNQERIIAQTKLAAAEEQLKNISVTTSSPCEGATSNTIIDSSCNDHIRLLAEAEDRIRILESDIENYQTVIADNDKKANALVKEHEDFVAQSQVSINKLIKDLETKSAAVAIVQAEGEKNMMEFKALHEKVVASQKEIINEKQTLEEKLKSLDEENLLKDADIKTLRETVEEKITACSEAETKLAAEIKANEEYRQTITALRADVSNLTSEISEYKSNADAVKATMESLEADYKREANSWIEYKESLKRSLTESEKQREKLTERVEKLVQQHAEWKAAVVKDTSADDSAFEGVTNDVLQQLREANETLRIERDANETRYRYEHENLKRVEAEIIPLKKQVDYLQADCERLREENSKLGEMGSEETGNYRMQCDAFKIQNRTLIQENERLRERKELALAELDKKNAELTPLIVKISTLESELKQSQEEVAMLSKAQKEWTSRSAQLLSKYNRVDPAESDRIKSELEAAKAELETTKAKIAELEATVETLKTQLKTSETERTALVGKANDRGRLAFEFKKKLNEAERKLAESEKKLEESEKKLKTAETASVNTTHQNNSNSRLLKEKETAELAVKTLEDEKKKAEEAKAVAEIEQKKAEDSLKTRMDEYTALEKKYNNILLRARLLQQEKGKLSEELKTLRSAGGDKSEVPALKAKISELETELTTVRKTLAENSVELTRLKAQNSMAQNKSNRLQKELDALKALKGTTSTLSANAPSFQVSTPTITASPVSSPVIASLQPNKASSSPIKEKNKQPLLAASAVNTPDLSATPAPLSVDSPVVTPVSTATPPPTAVVESEETTADTLITSTTDTEAEITNEVEDLNAPVAEPVSASTPSAAAEVDADLSMEDDKTTNEQVNEDISESATEVGETNAAEETAENSAEVEGTDEIVEDAPVEIEVHEAPAEKVDSPQLDATEEHIVTTNDEGDKNDETHESPVSPAEETEEGEVEEKAAVESTESSENAKDEISEDIIGSKRKDRPEGDAEDTDNVTPESPSKKLHTSTEE